MSYRATLFSDNLVLIANPKNVGIESYQWNEQAL